MRTNSINVYKPNEVYIDQYNSEAGKNVYFEYEAGQNAAKQLDRFEDLTYRTYSVSPDDKETIWVESRDGKNVVLVGNNHGEDGKPIATLESMNVYGWYGEYLLLSKNASELYIMGREGGTPLKVTDYHKPSFDFRGYGYGYGGS